MNKHETIGFIGLGVMGGPMCQNMARKHAGRVIAFDLSEDALATVVEAGAEAAPSVEALAGEADLFFLSLPGGPQVEKVSAVIAEHARGGSAVVDLSTTEVATARRVAKRLAEKGVAFADAPVARTREAAQRGELAIMVGAAPELFQRIRPALDYVASDITHGGDVGAGQVLKLVNNMLVFAHTAALAEVMVLGERAGVSADTLLDAISKGSGDSFVLRNHGRKAMAPRAFPAKSFSPAYVLKDIDCVFALARDADVALPAAEAVRRYYAAAVEQGMGERYFPCIVDLVESGALAGASAGEAA